jgi:hypothetical protein
MAVPRERPLWIEAIAAGALYAVLTIVMAWPLSAHPGSTVLPLGADTKLFLWTIGWDLHALVHQPFSIFDANIFYPLPHTLAYSENAIGSAIFAAPVLLLTGNPVLALNSVLLLACVLCGVGAYVLARRLELSPGAALLAGVIFAFTPPRFFRTGQLHLATIQWLPFCLASLHEYLKTGRVRHAWWASAFLGLELLTSGHGTIFILLASAGLIAWHAAFGSTWPSVRSLEQAALPGVLVVALAGAVFIPYRAAQLEVGLKRSLGDSYRFSANAASFIASPTHLHKAILAQLTHVDAMSDANALLFPGYLPLLLGLVGFWRASIDPGDDRSHRVIRYVAAVIDLLLAAAVFIAVVATAQDGFRLRLGATVVASVRQPWRAWSAVAILLACRIALTRYAPLRIPTDGPALREAITRWRQAVGRRGPLLYYATLTLISLWLAFGPAFGLYRIVYNWPGFSFIRVPSRFTLVTVLGLAVLAAAGFDWLTRRSTSRSRTAWTALAAIVLLLEFYAAPLLVASEVFTLPPADRWLATQQMPFAVAEFPVDPENEVAWNLRQSEFMLHSMAHWQKTIHGYSGITPRLHQALFQELAHFPDARSLDRLEGLGVNFVVVHTSLYPAAAWPAVDARLRAFPDDLTLVYEDHESRVYRLRARPDRTGAPENP